ncbi:MAG TPA: alpha/beta hydrolase [Thermotogota bacterium]|nr:alpha/beta hydrolase [Thermotogota bacterium]
MRLWKKLLFGFLGILLVLFFANLAGSWFFWAFAPSETKNPPPANFQPLSLQTSAGQTVPGTVFFQEMGSGEPLLLLHGFLGSHLDFAAVVQTLSSRFHVFVMDLPGFGLSDKNPELDLSKKGLAQSAWSFLQARGISRFSLLGHSMGGEVALNLALDHPESVSRLILVDSAGYSENQFLPGWVESNPWLGNLLFRSFFQTAMMQYPLSRSALYDASNLSFSHFARSFALVFHIPSKTLLSFNNQDDGGARAAEFSQLSLPTLLVWGEQDPIYPLEHARRFLQHLANSTLTVLPECGHSPLIEKPTELSESILAFLGSGG